MFDCDCCGACCRNVGRANFEHDLDRGDGVCKNLDEATNLCTVYESRPIFCNVDACYEKFLSPVMSRADWYALNHEICAELKNLTAAINRANLDA